MSFSCAVHPKVCAQLPHQQSGKRANLTTPPALRPPVLQWKRCVLCTSKSRDELGGEQARMKEELTSELSLLDDTLKQLQTELSAGEARTQEDSLLLAELVEKVETEQKAWIKDCEEMDHLVAKADALNSSEEEVTALKERYKNMKGKVNMLTGLVREKEREIGDLQEQLESVELMGEMKKLKETAPKLVAAGNATTDGSVPSDVQAQEASMNNTTLLSPDNPSITPENKSKRGALPFRPFKNIGRKTFEGHGMNVPGLVIASVVVTVSQKTSKTWSTLKKKLPKPVAVAVEVTSFLGATVALASLGLK